MAVHWVDTRPLSPHLQIWRWHATMATSILHRFTGFANAAGMILLAIWLVSLAAGPESYALVAGLLWSSPGKLLLGAFTASISFHLINGIRYLFWDGGHGYQPKIATLTAWIAMLGAMVITAFLWFAILFDFF